MTSSASVSEAVAIALVGAAISGCADRKLRSAVDRLHAQGVEVIMMTGDAEAVAKAVASDLGIDTVFAEVLPEHKRHRGFIPSSSRASESRWLAMA